MKKSTMLQLQDEQTETINFLEEKDYKTFKKVKKNFFLNFRIYGKNVKRTLALTATKQNF